MVLKKTGFSCTYSQAVVFGPAANEEIGSKDLKIEQEIIIIT